MVNSHLRMEFKSYETITQEVINDQHISRNLLNTECFLQINRTKNIAEYVSNFDDVQIPSFWKIISTEVLRLIYERKAALYNEWDQLVGPLTLSNYDKLSFQFRCMKRKLSLMGLWVDTS